MFKKLKQKISEEQQQLQQALAPTQVRWPWIVGVPGVRITPRAGPAGEPGREGGMLGGLP